MEYFITTRVVMAKSFITNVVYANLKGNTFV